MSIKIENNVFNCSIHGSYVANRFLMLKDWSNWSICPQCEKDLCTSEENEENKKKEHDLKNRCGIPKRFFNKKKFDILNENIDYNYKFCMDYASFFKDKYLPNGSSLILYGNTGTGKTDLSCRIALKIIQKFLLSVIFIESYSIFSMTKSTFDNKKIFTEDDLFRTWTETFLLIIDDIGTTYLTDYERLVMFRIINGRYNNNLPTIITTNLDKKGINHAIGERSFDRLLDNGFMLSFYSKSYRNMVGREGFEPTTKTL